MPDAPTEPPSRAMGFAVVGVATLIALALAEGVLRTLPDPGLIRFEQADRFAGERGAPWEGYFRPDPELFWSLIPGLTVPDETGPFIGVLSNGAGLREAREIPLEKPPGEVRILFLGDSSTFGWNLPYDQTFVRRAEHELQARLPGLPIVCIDAGVPGYSLFQGWRLLETRGRAYSPDLVVLSFGFNDNSDWDGLSDREHYARSRAERPVGPLAHSELARRIWRAAGRLQRGGDERSAAERKLRVSPSEFRSLLEAIHERVEQDGAGLLLLVAAERANGTPEGLDLVSRYQQEQLRYGDALHFGPDGGPAHADGVALVRKLVAAHGIDELFFDLVHPTALMNEHTGVLLADRIEPWLRARVAGAP